MKMPIYAALLFCGTSLGLAACSSGDAPVETEEANKVQGLEVSNARLVLPPVGGNPAAVYFDLANVGDRGIAIRNADVEKAGSAQMHGSMEMSGEMTMGETGPQSVQPGNKLIFEPGGLHVMVYDLDPGVSAGGSVDVTLIAAGGKTLTFPAEVRAAGDER